MIRACITTPTCSKTGDHALYLDYSVAGMPSRLAVMSLSGEYQDLFDLRDATFQGGDPIVGIADGVLLYLDDADALMAVGWDQASRRPTGIPSPVPGVPGGLRQAALASDGTLAMLVGPEAYDLLVVDDRGNPEIVFSGESVSGAYPRFSPDGSRIALASDLRGGSTELWTYELASSLMSQVSLGYSPLGVAWSPDGARLLGTTGFDRGAQAGIRSRAADGGDEPETLLAATGWQLHGLDVSGTSGTLAVAATQARSPFDPLDIVVRDLNGDTTFTAFAATASDEVAPRFSPDGRWLAYASDESGVFQVFVRPFPGPGPRVQISDAGGGQPVWSADGQRLFYLTEDAMVAALVEIDGTDERLSVAGRERLFRGDFYRGPSSPAATYDVHPDGRRFVVTRAVGGGGTDIIVWMNWMDNLKELLAETSR